MAAPTKKQQTSQYRGVNRRKNGRDWQANIWADNKWRYLGTFPDELSAARAYDDAARAARGPRAFVNFPEPGERPATARSYRVAGTSTVVLQIGRYDVLIDAVDEAFVLSHQWRVRRGTSQFTERYVDHSPRCPCGDGRWVPLPQLLLSAGSAMVDHRNGDGLDNRRANLRPATSGQNNANRRKTLSKTASRFKGVTRYPTKRVRWWAYITAGGQRRDLGCFDAEEAAARAYDAAARAVFGEFAALNFPGPGERSALTGVGGV